MWTMMLIMQPSVLRSVKNVFAGDSVYLQVAADDYKDNIAIAGVPDSMLPVAVYGLRSKDRAFLTLDNYCKEANSNGWVGVVCLVIAGAVTLALYLDFRRKRKLRKWKPVATA